MFEENHFKRLCISIVSTIAAIIGIAGGFVTIYKIVTAIGA